MKKLFCSLAASCLLLPISSPAKAELVLVNYQIINHEKVHNNSIMLAQIGLTKTQVTISPNGFDPKCGAFRATVSTNWGTYTACYSNRSNKQISGSYTLYYYNQPGGVWYSFDNGNEPSYVKWETVAPQ